MADGERMIALPIIFEHMLAIGLQMPPVFSIIIGVDIILLHQDRHYMVFYNNRLRQTRIIQ
jgi:hypothetical protein